MEEEKKNRIKWLHLRLTDAEDRQLRMHWGESSDGKLSDFARKKLLGRPVAVFTRDRSKDSVLEALLGLRAELSKAAVNYNQAIKKLHILGRIKEFEHWLLTYEIDRRKLLAQIDKLTQVCENIDRKW